MFHWKMWKQLDLEKGKCSKGGCCSSDSWSVYDPRHSVIQWEAKKILYSLVKAPSYLWLLKV